MRRFIKRISPDTGVGAEDPELVWHQTLRSIGRIEQLEAKEDDLRKKFRQIQQILKYSGSSQWATTESQFPTPHLSWQEVAEAPDVFFEFDEDVGSWEPAQLVKQPVGPAIDRIVPPYYEKLSRITKLFTDLEEDFDEVPRRIVRCALLEEELAALENFLENQQAEYLGWCVALIKDVLDYNYAEELTQTHLELLKKAIDLICEKGPDCDREDCQSLHKDFLQTGLALIPTSHKAIEKYEPNQVNGE